MPQLDKLQSLSRTGDFTYSQNVFAVNDLMNHNLFRTYLYQVLITDRAITDGKPELQGNECLKTCEIICEPCLTIIDHIFDSLFITGRLN